MITKECIKCNKKFKVFPYRKDTALYCSLKCQHNSLLGRMSPKKGKPSGIIAWNKGIKNTKETRQKISDKLKGRKLSVEHIMKIQKTRKGYKHSDETKKKLSKSHIGISRKLSDNEKQRLSDLYKGEKCRFWQGGKSFEKYSVDWTKTLRQSIRERDCYRCSICGENQGDVAHSVHHIDYNKINCNPDNLITLCHSCHTKTNFNREHWKEYFNNGNL